MTILILASEQDFHARKVADQLEKQGSPYEIFQLNELLQRDRLTYEFPGRGLRIARSNGAEIDFSSVTAVWNRRPGRIKSANLMPESWMETMIENESNRALSGMLRTLKCLWVNHPGKQEEAYFKLYQLKCARDAGLLVPDTIVTNDPAQAKAFYERCDGKVVYKLVDESSNNHFPVTEMPRGIPTLPLRPVDVAYLEQVSQSLHLFQQRVDKVADIRVTIIGSEVFAARIESQQGDGKIDFRLDYSVPVSVYELPPQVMLHSLRVMRTLGLEFGALDFCLDAAGEHVFLEVNPAGQFLWLEDALQLPLSETLAKLLSGALQPIVTDPH
jgi:glutathione synthase/RimK-type ligase-like ATP-grasp enzyme